METVNLRINCRIAELPVLGGFLLSSMQLGLADFTAFSPDYDAAFMTASNAELAVISGLINPKQMTAELKMISNRMYQNRALLRGKIDLLEGYIKRASGLTMDKKDFGIKDLRTKNNRGDVEGVIAALAYVLANVGNNMAALTDRGYTPGLDTELTAIKDDLVDDNIAQNDKINERNNNVIANYDKLNAFWDRIVDISDAGKRIYKTLAPNKVDDFTMSKLKERMRQEHNNTRIYGVISSGGEPLNGAKVSMKPLGAGRSRVGRSKADGRYELKSMEPVEYEITVSALGKTSIIGLVTIETNMPLNRDFELE